MKKFNTWAHPKNKCSISYNKKSPVVLQEIFFGSFLEKQKRTFKNLKSGYHLCTFCLDTKSTKKVKAGKMTAFSRHAAIPVICTTVVSALVIIIIAFGSWCILTGEPFLWITLKLFS